MKITQTKDIRTANRWQVLHQVLHHYPVSRTRLCSLTGLNKATISIITKEWLDLSLLAETARGDTQSGRRPILLEPQLGAGCILAVDIDVGRVEAVLTDLSGENVLQRAQFSITDSHFAAVYRQLYLSLDELLEQQPASRYGLVGIGVSVHGIVDLNGLIRFVPRLGWRNIDLKALLQERYHVPVLIDNDGNLMAAKQQSMDMEGGAPVSESLCVLNVSESISAGIIINGEMLRGQHGFASAIGHHTIKIDEKRQCYCGKYGCWEQYCTDSAVLEYAAHKLGRPLSGMDELISLIRHQDPAAEKVLDRFLRYLAVGITNIVFIFDCETIVINSRILNELPYYLPRLLEAIVLPITHTEKILLSRTCSNTSLLGAAQMAQEAFFKELCSTAIPD